jgi:hypothetical protein
MDFSRRDPVSSGIENVFPVDVVPYAKGQSFQKPKQHQGDALSRAPSVLPDIIEVSHASVPGVQSQERVLNSDKVAPSPPLDPIDRIVAQVLEIIPDVSPPHAHSLAQQYYPDYQSTTHEMIVHALLEDPNYPKVFLVLPILRIPILTSVCSVNEASGSELRMTKVVRERGKQRNQRSIIFPRTALIPAVTLTCPLLWCVLCLPLFCCANYLLVQYVPRCISKTIIRSFLSPIFDGSS